MRRAAAWRGFFYSGGVVSLGEKALIERIRRKASEAARKGRSESKIITGIGDDCAVLRLPPSHDLLVTTDLCLEGIHFRREWHAPESVGHRCLARGLSDIAAMGGDPLAAFLSLALPRDLSPSWVERFARTLLKLAEKFGITLAGGDTAEFPKGILADIVVLGSVPKGNSVLRSGARVGDRVFVSGELGGSAAAVSEMSKKRKLRSGGYPRHFFPEPRIELGKILREKKLASAMIDISDGLSTDLAHICEESGVGAEVQAELIPRASVGKPARAVDLQLALHGGEDYELLFTAPSNRRVPSRIVGVPITHIGDITRGRKISLVSHQGGISSELEPKGWEHFRS